MRKKALSRLLQSLILGFYSLLILGSLFSCTTYSGESTNNSETSDEDSDFDDTFTSESADILIERTLGFNFSDAQAILLYESPLRTEPGSVNNPYNTPIETNLWILDADGTLMPAIFYASKDVEDTLRLNAERVVSAPHGEVFIILDHKVTLEKESKTCRVFLLTADRKTACADSGLENDFNVFQVEFASDGSAYFAALDGRIRKYDASTGVTEEIFNGDTIGFELDAFLPSPNEGIIINGSLNGTAQEFFHYNTDSGLFTTQCPRSLSVNSKYDLIKNEIYLSSENIAYIASDRNVCAELAEVNAFRISANGDSLSYDSLDIPEPLFFAEDSLQTVYAAVDEDDGMGTKLINLNTLETITTSVVETENFKAENDQIFSVGYDNNGEYLFIRKDLLGARSESTIISENDNLIIRNFSATPDGVLFTATSLTTGERFLYRYNAASNANEKVSTLVEDVEEITVLE